MLEINGEVGDIVRWGQKHKYKRRKSFYSWGVAKADGTVEKCTEAKARQAWDGRRNDIPGSRFDGISDSEILAETIRRGLKIQQAQGTQKEPESKARGNRCRISFVEEK